MEILRQDASTVDRSVGLIRFLCCVVYMFGTDKSPIVSIVVSSLLLSRCL
jgi:hypothetical protein